MRYYVEASIDIKWNLDPYVRMPFSVAARIPSALFTAPMLTGPMTKEIFPDCFGCCELTCMASKGSVALDATLSRNGARALRLCARTRTRLCSDGPLCVSSLLFAGGAPGEWLTVSGGFSNSLKESHADLVVRLECRSHLYAEGRHRAIHEEIDLLRSTRL